MSKDLKCVGVFWDNQEIRIPEFPDCDHILTTEKISKWEEKFICKECGYYFYVKRRY